MPHPHSRLLTILAIVLGVSITGGGVVLVLDLPPLWAGLATGLAAGISFLLALHTTVPGE